MTQTHVGAGSAESTGPWNPPKGALGPVRVVAVGAATWMLACLVALAAYVAAVGWSLQGAADPSLAPFGLDSAWTPWLAGFAVVGMAALVPLGLALLAREFPAYGLGARPTRVGVRQAWRFVRAARKGDPSGLADFFDSVRGVPRAGGRPWLSEDPAGVEKALQLVRKAHRAFRARRLRGWMLIGLALAVYLFLAQLEVLPGQFAFSYGIAAATMLGAGAALIVELAALDVWVAWYQGKPGRES